MENPLTQSLSYNNHQHIGEGPIIDTWVISEITLIDLRALFGIKVSTIVEINSCLIPITSHFLSDLDETWQV